MEIKTYLSSLKKQREETEQEQEFDYLARQRADAQYLLKDFHNPYAKGTRKHEVFAVQMKVNEERNK